MSDVFIQRRNGSWRPLTDEDVRASVRRNRRRALADVRRPGPPGVVDQFRTHSREMRRQRFLGAYVLRRARGQRLEVAAKSSPRIRRSVRRSFRSRAGRRSASRGSPDSSDSSASSRPAPAPLFPGAYARAGVSYSTRRPPAHSRTHAGDPSWAKQDPVRDPANLSTDN